MTAQRLGPDGFENSPGSFVWEGPMREKLHGDAVLYQWVNYEDKSPIDEASTGNYDGIILGVNQPGSSDGSVWWTAAKRGHGLCFCQTGGGKNTNLITSALLTYAGSAFVLDVKGENSWITAPRRRAMGQRVVNLDPWNVINETYGYRVKSPEKRHRFNPLFTLDPGSHEFNDELNMIADALIIPDRKNSYWTDSARDLLAGLIAAAIEQAPGFATFADVRDLLTAPNEKLVAAIQEIVLERPRSIAARKLARFAEATDEIRSIKSTTLTQTAILDAHILLNTMDQRGAGLDFRDLVRKRLTVYVVLPADKLNVYGRWMRLMVQLALTAVAKETTPPRLPVLFLLDELGTISPGGGLPMLEQAFGLLGSKGVRVWGFFQDLNQIKRDYPHSWETFIANSETIQIMRVNDMTTARYFSEFMGNKTAYSGTQPVSRPLMFPQEIMKMESDEIVILRAGKGPMKLKSIPYFKEPRFDGKFRQNPLYRPSSFLPRLGNVGNGKKKLPRKQWLLFAFLGFLMLLMAAMLQK